MLVSMAAVRPPLSLPKKVQFFLPTAIPLRLRSAPECRLPDYADTSKLGQGARMSGPDAVGIIRDLQERQVGDPELDTGWAQCRMESHARAHSL